MKHCFAAAQEMSLIVSVFPVPTGPTQLPPNVFSKARNIV